MRNIDWLLLYLGLPSADGYIHEDAIRIQYSLFFFYMENKEKIREFYTFKPYLYGPSSLDILKDLKELQKQNLIIDRKIKFNGPTYYMLLPEGYIKAKKLIHRDAYNLVDELKNIKQRLTELSYLQLLKLIYSQYPEYARNNLINVEMLNDANFGVGM